MSAGHELVTAIEAVVAAAARCQVNFNPSIPPAPLDLRKVDWSSPLLTFHNPQCTHERSSYDIATCPACIDFTKKVKEAKLNAETPVIVGTPS